MNYETDYTTFDPVEFDCETTGLQPWSGEDEAFLWIFMDSENEAEAIPFTASGNPIPGYPGAEEPKQREENKARIQWWFDKGKTQGIRAWNTKFDRAFADVAECFELPGDGMWHDGMIVAHAIDERRSVALKAVASSLFGEEAADPQKALKEWLTKENARRKSSIRDAEKAKAGVLKRPNEFAGEKYAKGDVLPDGRVAERAGRQNKFRPATEAENQEVIAEAESLIDPRTGDYVRANYSHVTKEIMDPYAKEDVILTRKVCDVYTPKLLQSDDLARVVTFERGVMDALYAIEKRGLPAEAAEYRKLEQEVINNLVEKEKRVRDLVKEGDPVIYAQELAGDDWKPDGKYVETDEDGTVHYKGGAAHMDDFNPKSSYHIIAALKARGADLSHMSKYRMVRGQKTPVPFYKSHTNRKGEKVENEGKYAADAQNLRAVDDELANAVLEFRSEFKVLSTYVRPMIGRSYVSRMNVYKTPFISERDSRIHATYRQLGARTGRMSCIAEGSYVDAPRDLLKHPKGIKIEDVEVGQYVYSFDATGVPRAKRVLRVLNQGEKKVLRLVWRAAGNKSYLGELEATPDHRVRLRNGSYKRMDALQPGDQLAFLSRQVTGDGYARICWKHGTGDGVASSVDEHRHLVRDGEVVHHINQQKLDNGIENLAGMSMSAHSSIHNPVGVLRPDRQKPCPYTADRLAEMLECGIKHAVAEYPHDHRTFKRWAEELEVSVPDTRRRSLEPTNHVVVAVMDDGKAVPTYDLTIEDTPNFVVNEIGVHNCSDPNMQNQPRDDLRLRYNIKADPGHVLITCDLTNIEMYLFAAYCGAVDKDSRLLRAVRSGEDLHTLTAKMMQLRDRQRAGGTVETARQQGKTFNFLTIYGGGIRTIKKSFRVDDVEAQRMKKMYNKAYPEVRSLSNMIEYRITDHGFIQEKHISGRRFRLDKDDAFKAVNYLVQGTAASLLKYAVQKLHEDGVPMVALVHDEIVAHVPIEDADRVAKLIEKRMTEHPTITAAVPLAAEADIVTRWSDAKTLTDERGKAYYFDPEWSGAERRYVDAAPKTLISEYLGVDNDEEDY